MPVIGGSAGTIAAELERVDPKITILFERDDVFYSKIEKRPGEIVSEISMRMPLEIHPAAVVSQFSSDGDDLGLGDMPDYDKAEINTVEMEIAVQWTSRRKYAVDSSRKAVLNTFRRDLASTMKEFRRANDSLCMTAGNGVLGIITTVVNVGGAGGVDTYTLTTDGFGARLLRMKQPLNVWDPTLAVLRNPATLAGQVKVSYYDGPNKTIQVINSPGNVQPGDLLVFGGKPNQTAPPTSLLGIPYHATNSSTGTWLGFNRATTPEIRANRVVAGGALSLPMPRLAMNKIGDRIGIDKRKKLSACMHPCQKQQYEELGFEASIINKDAKEQGLDLYFNDNMRMAGCPVSEYFSWDKTRIDFIDFDIWGRAEFYGPGWYKDENGLRYFVLRGATGGVATSNIAYITAAWNLYPNNPAGISYIDSLTVPSGY
jgi:hypothetical protein